MVLIECPDCGKEFSNKATACPNCGFPLTEEFKIVIGNLSDYQRNPNSTQIVDSKTRGEDNGEDDRNGFKNEHEQDLKKRAKERNKHLKYRFITAISTVLITLCAYSLFQYYETTIKPAEMYKHAINLLDNHQYTEAKQIFTTLGDYRECSNYLIEISYQEAIELLDNMNYAQAKLAFESLDNYKESKSKYEIAVSKNPVVLDEYQGGIIYYILKKGDAGYDSQVPHGLIVSTEDQSSGIDWSTIKNVHKSVKGTLTKIGSGKLNTYKIILQNGEGSSYAAGLASAYQGGGYSDWYLPSKDELNELYKANYSVMGLSEAYWSSSQYLASFAWFQNITDGSQDYSNKGDYWYGKGARVRAIRAF